MTKSDPMKSGRFATWAAHHFTFCLIMAALTPVPFFILGAQNPNGTWLIDTYSELGLLAFLIVWTIASLVMVLGVISGFGHFEKPCVDCATTFPLDAARNAERWQRAFNVHHSVGDIGKVLVRATGQRYGLAMLLFLGSVVFVCAAVIFLLTLVTSQPWTAPLALSTLLLPILVMSWPAKKHFQLAPWCEGCQEGGWGDDGPEEPSPDIFPLPTLTKKI